MVSAQPLVEKYVSIVKKNAFKFMSFLLIRVFFMYDSADSMEWITLLGERQGGF